MSKEELEKALKEAKKFSFPQPRHAEERRLLKPRKKRRRH